MSDWKNKSCTLNAAAEILNADQVAKALSDIPEWTLTKDGKRISRTWRVENFLEALSFFQKIGELAEAENHHPDLHVESYRNVTVELWTHLVDGLSANDFIIAAKINKIPVAVHDQ